MTDELAWWQRGVIYQVFVRSFQDSNGDGIGDLPGLTSRLDYIRDLGAGAVWLSPIYPSPWLDAGYDVLDFENVEPRFGTMADLDRLIAAAEKRGIRIILDWVPNHTSDRHPWFQEARSGRDHPRRNWFIWADPATGGGPPNNWLSVFGGSAWQREPVSGQYYYHAFLPQQPDLNWQNPEVREAMYGNLAFWLARGVAGLRIDALDMLLEDPELPDNPPNPDFDPEGPPDTAVVQKFTRNQPELHAIVAELRRRADVFPNRVLLGETYMGAKQLAQYYGTPERPELHLPLNPLFLRQRWDADEMTCVINEYLEAIPSHGWPTWSLGNHDMNRVAGRATGDQLRVAAMLLLTLRGTPTVYYGDEIGMHDVPVPPERMEDPQGLRQPHRSRDVARSAMQWDDSRHAGFSTGEPSVVVAADYRAINVAGQQQEARSLLSLYRRLIALRQSERELAAGLQSPVMRQAPTIAYLRKVPNQRLLIVLNLAGDAYSFDFTGNASRGQVLLRTTMQGEGAECPGQVQLQGNEGVILRLS